MFTKSFRPYVCEGDSISCEVEGYTITARIEYDDCWDTPDERVDGFWPSKNPTDAGYIGKNPEKTYEEQLKRAQDIMKAWKNDEWFYCGVILSISKNGITLDNHAASLWGVECNYPDSDNSYLTETANELLDEALARGKEIIAKLTNEEKPQ